MGQIDIIGEIGTEVKADDVIAQIESYGPDEVIKVNVLSEGGCVEQGLRIFNALNRHLGPVAVHIDKADSVAASFSQAGTPGLRTMASNGEMMIHLPMIRLQMANELDLEKLRDFLKVQKSRLISTLKPTGISPKKLGEMFDNETFLDAEMAKKLGFIDEIVENSKAVAMLKMFNTVKKALARGDHPEEGQIHAQGDETETEEPDKRTVSEMLEELAGAGIDEEMIVKSLAQMLTPEPKTDAGGDDPEADAAEKGDEGDMTGGGVREAIRTAQEQGYTIEEIGAAVDRDASTLQAILAGEIDNPPEGLNEAIRALPPKGETEAGDDDEEHEVQAMFIEKFYNAGKLTKAQLPWAKTQTVAQLREWGKTAPKVVALGNRPDFKAAEADTEQQIKDPEVTKTGTTLSKTHKS